MSAAVAAHLMLHLGDELLDCPAAPVLALPAVGEQGGDCKQPDDVGQVVVAASIAVLGVRADEPAVQEEASRVGRNQGSSALSSAQRASAATQFAARMATSIVDAQLGPSSTGFARIQEVSWAPSSSR